MVATLSDTVTGGQHAQASALLPGYEARTPGISFSTAVAANGYLWWYADAVSDDGDQAMTLIVFVGSVFSPYYARARRYKPADPEQYCSFNAILYGPGQRKRWSMTERSTSQLKRSARRYALGPSSIEWDGHTLLARIDERCTPIPRRMQGSIRIAPGALTPHSFLLDEHGRHRWHPLSPQARVDIDFPGLRTRWSGWGYLDSNEGNEPLADGFRGWDWTRVRLENGDCLVRYEAREAQRQPHRLALRFSPDGALTSEQTAATARLPKTRIWRLPRRMPSASGGDVLLRTLEDTPFYARSLVSVEGPGGRGVGVHESLSMTRFCSAWVQTLLPFRMPRRA